MLAPAQLSQQRNVDLVDQRRPQELECVSQSDEREDAHRLEVHIRLGQPGKQRAQEKCERQAAGKAEQQHEAGLAVAERQTKRSPG